MLYGYIYVINYIKLVQGESSITSRSYTGIDYRRKIPLMKSKASPISLFRKLSKTRCRWDVSLTLKQMLGTCHMGHTRAAFPATELTIVQATKSLNWDYSINIFLDYSVISDLLKQPLIICETNPMTVGSEMLSRKHSQTSVFVIRYNIGCVVLITARIWIQPAWQQRKRCYKLNLPEMWHVNNPKHILLVLRRIYYFQCMMTSMLLIENLLQGHNVHMP